MCHLHDDARGVRSVRLCGGRFDVVVGGRWSTKAHRYGKVGYR
jgi:hypothetical protein